MLLSRTASDVYWFGRHLERAESIARVVDQHTSMLVDLPVDIEADWSVLLGVTGATDSFAERYDTHDEGRIIAFTLADISNPSSLVRTISATRENLRVTRQLLPRSAWETLNRVHHEVVEQATLCGDRAVRRVTLHNVIDRLRQLGGLLDAAMARDDTWRLCQLGRHLERADLTARVLDVRAATLLAAGSREDVPPADRSPYEDVRWLGVLRALEAHHMYMRSTTGGVEPTSVLRFLIDDASCPRSIAHCVATMSDLLGALPDRPPTAAALDRLVDAVRPDGSADATPVERGAVVAPTLHRRLERTQRALIVTHAAIEAAYLTGDAHPAGTLRADVSSPMPAQRQRVPAT